jgi:hypothetical protein
MKTSDETWMELKEAKWLAFKLFVVIVIITLLLG